MLHAGQDRKLEAAVLLEARAFAHAPEAGRRRRHPCEQAAATGWACSDGTLYGGQADR